MINKHTASTCSESSQSFVCLDKKQKQITTPLPTYPPKYPATTMAPTLRRRANGKAVVETKEENEAPKKTTNKSHVDGDDGGGGDDDDHDLKKERAVEDKTTDETATKKMSSTKTTSKNTEVSKTDAGTLADNDTAKGQQQIFHYYVFSLLFMIGFMCHSRKYFTINCRVCMVHIMAYIICPIPGSTKATPIKDKLRELVFSSFLLYVCYTTYDESPFNANHHNVCGFISLLLLPSQLQRTWYGLPSNKKTSSTSEDSQQMSKKSQQQKLATSKQQQKSSPVVDVVETTEDALNHVRCAIVIMYFMAGFHKINDDFMFNPNVSCAYHMLWDYLELFFGIVEPEDLDEMPKFLKLMPYLGLIVELVPPVLLCFRSTQMYAVLMLVKLHWMLLPVGFADFGSIAQSFLWLFVSADKSTEALPHHLWGQMAGYLVFFEAITYFLWVKNSDKGTERSDVPLHNEEAAIVFSTFAIVWWNILRVGGLSSGVPMRLPKSMISLGALAAFIFFAFNPYLGLRTVGTLAMFSNLKTEGPTSNHLLLRSNPIKIWGFQEDVVKVIDCASNFEEIQKDFSYQKIAFDRVMMDEKEAQEEDVYLKVLYNGVIYETNDLNNDPAFDIFRQKESWFSSKYMDFRDIQPPNTPQECVW